ncbi:MAG: DegT/DnrJ/EryC1/StrS aminotransferase family protein [Deltaproteobacteria bacterium]|nr:DegT/DnrJ/EryC1/StrS aminotransferase family protein [Deltaproteobacteria bacterium]
MRIGRTLPPATAPIYLRDIISGIRGLFSGQMELDRFKSELKDYFGVKHCFLFSSGKAALAFTLSTLKEMTPERDEVVLPAYVCYSVPSAIVQVGLKVVPCDMEPNTLDMDLRKLSSLLSSKTLCVIVPHLFGLPARMSEITRQSHEKGITVIEDAAQAMGKTCNGKMLGTQGDVGFFSLGRGKTLSTVEGGILVVNDPMISSRLRQKLSHLDSYNFMEKATLLVKALLIFLFSRPNLYWFPKLFPFLRLGDTIFDPKFSIKKMSGVQAGLARNWKIKLKLFNNQRKQRTQRLVKELSNNASMFLFQQNGLISACLRLPIFIKEAKDKERILSESEKRGLGIMFTYPDSIDGIPELSHMLNKPLAREIHDSDSGAHFTGPTNLSYPEARRMAQNILTLPVHPLVCEQDMQKIIRLFTQMEHGPST